MNVPSCGVALLIGAIGAVSCTRVPVTAAVSFRNSWTVDGDMLTAREQALVRATVFDVLRDAYRGFAVTFVEGEAARRIIRVEDTPYASDPHVIAFGAAGVTFPGSRVSSVRADVLFNAALSSIPCDHMTGCRKPRAELLQAWARGLGATAAHELGHQPGLQFVMDAPCGDCYDGGRSTSYAHFFGRLRWSDQAMRAMRRTLPRAP